MSKIKILFAAVVLMFLVFSGAKSQEPATNIDNNSKYIWSPGIGWINFAPEKGGVLVTDNELKGYAWSPAIGYIQMNPSAAGVKNDGQGNLSGFAWSQSVGWINFAPQGEGVKIVNGEFEGWAWGENIGWISFNCKNTYSCASIDYKVKTSWRSSDVKSDKIAPKTKIVPKSGKYSSIRTVTLFAQDNNGGSGIEGIYYTVNNSKNFSKYKKPLKITKDTIVKFYAQDKFGNKEKTKSAKYIIKKAKFVTLKPAGNEVAIQKDAALLANDFTFTSSLFPEKMKKNKFYFEVERKIAYAPKLSQAQSNSLKKYWLVNTNFQKYKIEGKVDVFQNELVFYYNDKEFKNLQSRSRTIKEGDLKLKYYNVLTREWKEVLAKHDQDKNTFTVSIASPSFFGPQMEFVIGK